MESHAAPTRFDPIQEMTKKSLELHYFMDPESPSVEFHAHPFCELYYFLEGPVESYVVGGRSYALIPGDILIMPPGVPHHPVFTRARKPYRRYVLWLSEAILDQLAAVDADLLETIRRCSENGTYHIRCAVPNVRQKMEDFLNIMWQEEQNLSACKTGYMASLCVNFLVLLNRMTTDPHTLTAQQNHFDLLLNNVLAYIHENYAGPISLNQVADQLYTSPSNIELLLRKKLGKPFYRYVTDCRIIHAQSLIASGMPMKEVGLACGYNDYSNFYRAFSRVVGISPSEYRKHFPLDHFQSTLISKVS